MAFGTHPPVDLQIINSTNDDLGQIFKLFDAAIVYQKKNGYDLWPRFSETMISEEIAGQRHWKILDQTTIVCVFSVMYSDPVIWGAESDKETAVYLHRIAVNPLFKGKKIMTLIKNWAITHAKQQGKQFVRMDTWGNNLTLREYYIACGFEYLGQQQLKEVEGQPGHYGGSLLSLFQLEV
ncbi:MAG TPA: GNAT family N-acetyltransferase [Bacteroidia bacterium]|nr:GNAT family N-acetyltransferase [Bacteroidia bacterium]